MMTTLGERKRKCSYCKRDMLNDERHILVVGGFQQANTKICSLCIERAYKEITNLNEIRKRAILNSLSGEVKK